MQGLNAHMSLQKYISFFLLTNKLTSVIHFTLQFTVFEDLHSHYSIHQIFYAESKHFTEHRQDARSASELCFRMRFSLPHNLMKHFCKYQNIHRIQDFAHKKFLSTNIFAFQVLV